MLSNHLILCCPLLLLPSIFPSIRAFSSESALNIKLHQVAKVLELQLQHQSFQWIFRVDFLYNWLIWSPCCSKDSQEFSPAPQFKNIHSSVLGLLYGPVLTSVGFPCGSAGKGSARNVGDLGLIPGLGRSPGEGKGYTLHYSGLENFLITWQVWKIYLPERSTF